MPDTKAVQQQPVVGQGGAAGSDDDYDPHYYRQVLKPTNNVETLIHLLKCSVGTGILAMPQAFGRAGLGTAVIATVVTGILITHSLQILVRAQYAACKRNHVPLLSFPESMTATINMGPPALHWLARPAAVLVDVFLVIYQLGICCVYIVFIASNLKKFVDPYVMMPEWQYMLIILIPLVVFNLIPTLKMLAPFSALANVLMVVALGIVLYYMIALRANTETPIEWFGPLSTFPLFFGTMLFALTAVGVVVAIENNMKTPKSFGKPCGVLNIGMGIVVFLYILMGVQGYLFCGRECHDSVTLDLPQNTIVDAMLVMVMIAIFISYALHCYVPVEIVWRGYVLPRLVAAAVTPRTLTLAEYGVRVVLTLLTFVLAALVPQLGLFISLFGALCLSVLGLCFPAIMDSCVAYAYGFNNKPSLRGYLRIFKNIMLFLVGLFGLFFGTYTALANIVRTFF